MQSENPRSFDENKDAAEAPPVPLKQDARDVPEPENPVALGDAPVAGANSPAAPGPGPAGKAAAGETSPGPVVDVNGAAAPRPATAPRADSGIAPDIDSSSSLFSRPADPQKWDRGRSTEAPASPGAQSPLPVERVTVPQTNSTPAPVASMRNPAPSTPTPATGSTPAPQAAPQTAAQEPEKTAQRQGLLDLGASEELMCEVDSGDDGRFVLTNQRLIYQGRSGDDALFSAAAVEDVTAIEFGRRERDARSAWWGVIGLIASIGVWQVTTNESVGMIAGAIVAGISLLLLADYWFRPAGLVLKFGTPGGAVEGPVSGKRVRDAEELAAQVQQLRQQKMPGNRAGSSSHPPGGSPGLG